MACKKTPKLEFKRGDDFRLDMTVTDKNNTTAIAAKEVWDAALAADPLDQAAVDAAEAVYKAAIIVDISGWTITSQVRYLDELQADLVVTVLNAVAGTFALSCPGSVTQDWKTKILNCDIEFDRGVAGKVSSQTFEIDVKEDVTHG